MSGVWWLDLYAKVVEIAALTLGAAFVVQYTWYSPWWRDAVGLTIVAEVVAVWLSVAPSVIESFFSLTQAERSSIRWMNISFVALVPIIFAWRILVWRKLPHGMNLLERWRSRRQR